MSTSPLPPEAIAELLTHLKNAGREVALGLQATVGLVRKSFEAQADAGRLDPSTAAIDDALRRLEQGLGFLVMLAPEKGPDPEAVQAAGRAILDRVVAAVEAMRQERARQGADEAELAALDQVLETLRTERDRRRFVHK